MSAKSEATQGKSEGASSSSGDTVESVLGPFTAERVAEIRDDGVKQAAEQCLTLATAIARVFLAPADTNEKVVAESLGEVNITVDDAKQLAADGDTLISLHDERVTKESAARAAAAKVEASKSHVHDQVQSFANIMRGQLGPKSSALELFGIKMLGGRGGARRKASKTGGNDSKPAGDASPTPSSNQAPQNKS